MNTCTVCDSTLFKSATSQEKNALRFFLTYHEDISISVIDLGSGFASLSAHLDLKRAIEAFAAWI